MAGGVGEVGALLELVQSEMLSRAITERDACTVDVSTVGEAIEVAESGFARIPWPALADGGVAVLAERALTVRCLQSADGEVPDSEIEPGVTALVARAY